MKRIICVTVLSFLAVLTFGQEKIVVVVAPFKAAAGVSQTEVDTIAQIMGNRLARTRVVDVVSRTKLDEIIREHKFQVGDWSNSRKTAELGEALNADWIITGELSKVGSRLIIFAEPLAVKNHQVMGGADLPVANMDDAYDKIDTLIQTLVATMTGGAVQVTVGGAPPATAPPEGAAPAGFVLIQGGTFLMGSPASEIDRSSNETRHTVTVSNFYMGKHEVTQAEYEAVMGTNPSMFKGANLPVEQVSWYDAIEYCNKRSERERLSPAYTINKTRFDPNNTSSTENDTIRWIVTPNKNSNGYRLPTWAEWEYACRAGTTTPFNTGNNITTNQANYDGNYPYNKNAKGTYREKTTTVGSFAPNRWGLYDMHGNVWEWCWDWYGGYSMADQTDPMGAASGEYRVYRGGSWINNGQILRSAYRYNYTPSYRDINLGIRLVRP